MLEISIDMRVSANDSRSRVTDKGGSHLESSGSNVTVCQPCTDKEAEDTDHWAAEMFPGIHSTK